MAHPKLSVNKGIQNLDLNALVELGRSHDQLILVYQMGKVGSRTVLQSLRRHLRRNRLEIPLFHSHFLNGDRLQHQLDRFEKSGMSLKAHLLHSLAIRQLLDQHQALERKNWKIITLVRDPIARNISGFFQNIRTLFPQALNLETSGTSYTQAEIKQVFLTQYGHSLPLTWLDEELTSVFGIDPYTSPFPWEQGYEIYQDKQVELLLIRLENLTLDTAQKAFKEFLGLEGLELKQKNVGDRKHYSEAYKRFQAEVQLPPSYLDRMYESRYAQQFYSPSERQQFRDRWSHHVRD